MTQYSNKEKPSDNIYDNVYSSTTKMGFLFALLCKWKGSVFKLLYQDLFVFLICYAVLSFLYRYVFYYNDYQRQMFELICFHMNGFSKLIPIAFLTGFYVSSVVNRWWDQILTLPWPDKLALKLVNFCPGTDEFNRNLRRTVMRYANLSTILVYRLVSPVVMERFPNYESLVNAKLMLPHEVERLEKTDEKTPLDKTTWAPLLWAMKLLTKARCEGKVKIEAPIFANLISSFEAIETANRKILNYGWVNFPLAYTQVATVSVYLYFLAALFGRQYLTPHSDDTNFNKPGDAFEVKGTSYMLYLKEPYKDHSPDFHFPFFTCVEFLCYMGWIKVAANLLNPFGDDDEDFKINYLIDRNLQVSYIIVDEADRDIEMENDPFLAAGIDIPEELPYQDPTGKNSSAETLAREEKMTPKSSPKSDHDCKTEIIDIDSIAQSTFDTMIATTASDNVNGGITTDVLE